MTRRHLALVLLLASAACSKKSESPSTTAGSGSAAAPTDKPADKAAEKAAETPEPVEKAPAGKPAPSVTPEWFLAEPPKFTIEGVERGLWTSDAGAPFQQSCRVNLGTTMVRVGKIRDEAKAKPDAVKCEAKGAYAVCTFEDKASWIFAADDDSDETILIAVVTGAADWAKIEPQLPAKTACPRPSQD
jgi:hypothetical protein